MRRIVFIGAVAARNGIRIIRVVIILRVARIFLRVFFRLVIVYDDAEDIRFHEFQSVNSRADIAFVRISVPRYQKRSVGERRYGKRVGDKAERGRIVNGVGVPRQMTYKLGFASV